MIFEVTDIPRRRLQVRPVHLATACVAAALAFTAHGQQPEPGPGETRPAAAVREGPWDPMGEPDQLNASDIANAVGEAEAELDAGLPEHPAQIQQVPAAATNEGVRRLDHPKGLALWA